MVTLWNVRNKGGAFATVHVMFVGLESVAAVKDPLPNSE